MILHHALDGAEIVAREEEALAFYRRFAEDAAWPQRIGPVHSGIGTAPNLAMDEPAPDGIHRFEISYGIPVVSDPTMPEGTIEFRNADWEVVGTMENVKP